MNPSSESLTQDYFRIDSIPGIPALWEQTLGSKDVCIAVIDSNIDYRHSSFHGANIRTIDLLKPGDSNGENEVVEHGTNVASIIFGQHESPVKGLAPRCRGIIIPVFHGREGESISCSQLDLARAIQIADQNGANIINISGG